MLFDHRLHAVICRCTRVDNPADGYATFLQKSWVGGGPMMLRKIPRGPLFLDFIGVVCLHALETNYEGSSSTSIYNTLVLCVQSFFIGFFSCMPAFVQGDDDT